MQLGGFMDEVCNGMEWTKKENANNVMYLIWWKCGVAKSFLPLNMQYTLMTRFVNLLTSKSPKATE